MKVPILAGCWLLGYWAPWRAPGGSNVWLLLASWTAAHGLGDLAKSSAIVTAAVAGTAVLGAVLRLTYALRPEAARIAGQAGLVLSCAPLCVLLPGSGAALFLLGIVAVAFAEPWRWGQANAVERSAVERSGLGQRLGNASFPVLSAFCFVLMSWQYNAQWLLRGLLVSSGVALVLRAALPSPIKTE